MKPNSKSKNTYPEKLSFSFFYSSGINHQATFIRRKLFFDHFLFNENFKIISDWEFFMYTICIENRPYKYLQMTISNCDFKCILPTKEYEYVADLEKSVVFNRYFSLYIEDYKFTHEINSKRIQQIFYIKKFKIPWKLFKGIINFLILFKFK